MGNPVLQNLRISPGMVFTVDLYSGSNLCALYLFSTGPATTIEFFTVTSSGARPDATDYYWFRSPMPNYMS